MATKFAALLTEFTDACEREDLEASAVGEHGSRKAIELVQSTCCFEYFQPGTQIEVVGIAQDDLRFHLVQNFMGVYALHCA